MSKWVREQYEGWKTSPANPDNWGIEEWRNNLWESRVLASGLLGLLAGSAFQYPTLWLGFLIVLVVMLIMDWDNRRQVKKKEMIE
jgi:hypothetical protein